MCTSDLDVGYAPPTSQERQQSVEQSVLQITKSVIERCCRDGPDCFFMGLRSGAPRFWTLVTFTLLTIATLPFFWLLSAFFWFLFCPTFVFLLLFCWSFSFSTRALLDASRDLIVSRGILQAIHWSIPSQPGSSSSFSPAWSLRYSCRD